MKRNYLELCQKLVSHQGSSCKTDKLPLQCPISSSSQRVLLGTLLTTDTSDLPINLSWIAGSCRALGPFVSDLGDWSVSKHISPPHSSPRARVCPFWTLGLIWLSHAFSLFFLPPLSPFISQLSLPYLKGPPTFAIWTNETLLLFIRREQVGPQYPGKWLPSSLLALQVFSLVSLPLPVSPNLSDQSRWGLD